MSVYQERIKKVAEELAKRQLAVCMFEDTEGRRNPSIRYLSGHPSDALLFVSANGKSILVPWDINMAHAMAEAQEILPYTDFARSVPEAINGIGKLLNLQEGDIIGLPSATPYPLYVSYMEKCEHYDFSCTDDGMDEFVAGMRAIKDAEEIAIYRKVSKITDDIMDAVEKRVRAGEFTTETDVALFIERALREAGCEATGFDTIAAGPSRSFGIHAFPSYSAAAFGTDGFSILDFGVVYKGYTSDVTMTFVRGALSEKQKSMLALVQQAYDEAVALCKPGIEAKEPGKHVDALFKQAGFTMPHSLGHGVGLEAHEMPIMRSREDNTWELKPGQIITIEPGLYDPEAGGVRLENDVLITETGHEVLTHSRIVFL
ncbi:MAG TPA: Xaa-Pro peptidase family protein [Spirochaetia bacterium]|nr:Xaa-Pro peptidase family protein [Spirochaetales bacterium]HPD80611.1 Xaa-Pro peptidase family protein [Spirochaetales bacterium]HQK34247.1 Xaa-Pro peptidase family protein [Spirochaetales bacterium]HRS64401.1 Xaa-Pro peptidase family protein [Spirochaetia bacterium]